MITGIDMLFVVIGLALLLLTVEIWDRYFNWYEWDRDKRRQRKFDRYELQESFVEAEYRKNMHA